MFLAACAFTAIKLQSPPKPTFHGVNPAWIDKTADPSTDFFRYADGKWLDSSPIPPEKSDVSADSDIIEGTQRLLREVTLEATKRHSAKGSVDQMVGDFYFTGIDEPLAEKTGIKPLQPELKRISDIRTSSALMTEMGRLQLFGVSAPVALQIEVDPEASDREMIVLWQSGLTLEDRDLYLSADEHAKGLRKKFRDTMVKIFTLAGDKAAETQATEVLDIETRLAKISSTPEETRQEKENYNPVDFKHLKVVAPGVDWTRFFGAVGIRKTGKINAGQLKFLKGVAADVNQVPLAEWRAYLRWHVLASYSSVASRDYVVADFSLESAMSGQTKMEPLWKRVLDESDGCIGEALGQLYVRKAFPPSAKRRILDLVANIKQAFKDRILHADWLSPATKAQAVEKLAKVNVKMGYPDKWKSYAGLQIRRDSYLANVMRSTEFAARKEIAKLGKPVDRSEWGMTPQTDNAYYDSSFNEVVFPAAILQPTYFDVDADDASNYGGIGATIGHELTHGFDDQGRLFDARGNLRDWWTEGDAKRYDADAAELAKQYDGYSVAGGVHLNGKQTLGENIADLGGLIIAYDAWKKADAKHPGVEKDGYTPEQRFFLAYGQSWRTKTRPEREQMLAKTDVHSPAMFRVNGIVTNVPAFYKAFGLPVPAHVVRIW